MGKQKEYLESTKGCERCDTISRCTLYPPRPNRVEEPVWLCPFCASADDYRHIDGPKILTHEDAVRLISTAANTLLSELARVELERLGKIPKFGVEAPDAE